MQPVSTRDEEVVKAPSTIESSVDKELSSVRGHVPLEFSEEDKKKYTYLVTKKMSEHPIACCSCTCIFILLIAVIAVATGLAALSEESENDWTITNTEESRNNDALDSAIGQVDRLSISSGVRTEEYDNKMFFLYKSNDGQDIFTPQNLHSMCLVETAIATDEEFLDFCLLDGGECVMPKTSVVVHFYDFTSVSDWNCTLLSEAEVTAKSDVIYTAMSTAEGQQQYGTWLSSDAVSKGYSTQVQSAWYFGAPLAGYSSTTDDETDQFNKYAKFLANTDGSVSGVEKVLFSFFDIDTNEDNLLAYYPSPYMVSSVDEENVNVMWSCPMVASNETTRLVSSDLLFAMFSIIFVWIWVRVHTGNTFLASMSIYMIFSSIPFAIFIYAGIFQITYFSMLHSLVVFIILGVGADDVFVLVDSWKLTPHLIEGYAAVSADPDPERQKLLTHRRLHLCYEHTMATVFNTSFTTAMAFLATAFSPIMPISTFGVFAATCIVVNFFFVITMMPPALIVAERYFMFYNDSCRVACDTTEAVKSSTAAGGTGAGMELVAVPQEEAVLGADGGDGVVHADTATEPGGAKDINSKRSASQSTDELGVDTAVSSSLSDADGVFIRNYIAFIEWGVPLDPVLVALGYDITTKPDTPDAEAGETVSRVPTSTGPRLIPVAAIIIAFGLLAFGSYGADSGTKLEPPSEAEQWLPSEHMFTLASDVMSNDFLSFDEDSYEQVTFAFGISGIDRSGYDQYKPGDNRGDAKFDANWDLAQPNCQKAIVKLCNDIETHQCTASACSPTNLLARTNTTECFMKTFRSWAQAEYGEDTYNMNETVFYSRLMEYRENEMQVVNTGASWQNPIGFIDSVLRFVTISFISTMDIETPLNDKKDVKSNIKSLMASVQEYDECNVATGGCDCRSLLFNGEKGSFIWMRTEEGLLQSFYQGIFIAFPVAFAVLMFATGNIIISIFAILSVFFITFGVLGFANYALDWDLGVAESIAGIIIIGFSVDYTVHLGHMFTHAEKEGGMTARKEKFEYTSRKIVVTIVGGAITTVGAGVFLFAAQLTFFNKMATLIVGTILLSYIYALGFFMSVLYLFGPEGTQGDIRVVADGIHTNIMTVLGVPVTSAEYKHSDDKQVNLPATDIDHQEIPLGTQES